MTQVKPRKTSIYHGPVNIVGIGGFLAAYQKKQGYKSDFVTLHDSGPFRNYDLNFDIRAPFFLLKVVVTQLFWFPICLLHYSHFNFYFGKTLLPFGLDLPLLRLFRKKIVMTYCGSDIRLISVERTRNPYVHLLNLGLNRPALDWTKRCKMRWQGIWCHKIIAVRNLVAFTQGLVPTEKLVTHCWVHNIGFDTSICPDPQSLHTNKRPLVVHAPSERNIKGTIYVERAIAELRALGVEFEYREVSGMPNQEAQKIYREADIIVDQFLIGGIGTLAFEGMGLGKPVVSYVLPDVMAEHFPDCPVYNTTLDQIAEHLEELISQPDLRLDLGRRGIAFVKSHIDHDTINQQVLELYQSL